MRDCWLWPFAMKADGHAQMSAGGKTVTVHRWVYERLVGPVPGLVLHHACFEPSCFNPGHLVPMTIGDHVRAHAPMRCPKCRGEYDYAERDGARRCRACTNKRVREWRAENRVRERARGRAWAAANPEKRRAIVERYKEKQRARC